MNKCLLRICNNYLIVIYTKAYMLVAQSCLILATPGNSVHGIFQARTLEWVAIPFSGGSFWPRDRTLSPALQADYLPSEPSSLCKVCGKCNDLIWDNACLQGAYHKHFWIFLLWNTTHGKVNKQKYAVLVQHSEPVSTAPARWCSSPWPLCS